MADDVMKRSRCLKNHLQELEWDEVVLASDLDAIGDNTDSVSLSITENSGEAHPLTYNAVNYMTYFLNDPMNALEYLRETFPSLSEEIGDPNKVLPDLGTLVVAKGGREMVVQRQALTEVAHALNEIEGRGTENPIRYYVTPYIRLLRKNYSLFDVDYMRIGGTGYMLSRNKMTKVIFREQRGTTATDW